MLVREFLEGKNGNVTFIRVRAIKDEATPLYHAEYKTTPIRQVWEWEKTNIADCIILNDAQPPIDWLSGASWQNDFNKGRLLSLLVINPEDFELLYPSKEQRESLVKFIDQKIKEKRK